MSNTDLVDQALIYKPRHKNPEYFLTIDPSPREKYVADQIDKMIVSLSPPVGRHRRGATNWYAYCEALRGVQRVLRGEV